MMEGDAPVERSYDSIRLKRRPEVGKCETAKDALVHVVVERVGEGSSERLLQRARQRQPMNLRTQ